MLVQQGLLRDFIHVFKFVIMHVLLVDGELTHFSLVPAFQELWNVWEIHCLVLISLFLQVFRILAH